MIPIDTVVELLMEQCEVLQDGTSILRVNGKWMNEGSPSSLRAAIRTYLSTLVPKPVKLSECEEGVMYDVARIDSIDRLCRCGEKAYDECGELADSPAKSYMVIQPAEVK